MQGSASICRHHLLHFKAIASANKYINNTNMLKMRLKWNEMIPRTESNFVWQGRCGYNTMLCHAKQHHCYNTRYRIMEFHVIRHKYTQNTSVFHELETWDRRFRTELNGERRERNSIWKKRRNVNFHRLSNGRCSYTPICRHIQKTCCWADLVLSCNFLFFSLCSFLVLLRSLFTSVEWFFWIVRWHLIENGVCKEMKK